MARHSNISWCTGTWNPILGCDKVSPGCTHCYAILQCWMKQHHPNETIRRKFEGLVYRRADGSLNWTGKVIELPERLAIPLKIREPTVWFVASMSDPFHENVSDDFIAQMFGVAALCPQHTFQFLTKRVSRAAQVMESLRTKFEQETPFLQVVSDPENPLKTTTEIGWAIGRSEELKWPLPNVWIGASTEDQKTADERIPCLLQIPAAVRFLSCEPLLGPIDLWHWMSDSPELGEYNLVHYGRSQPIDWVIAGGESGGGARRMDLGWARSLREQCESAGVAFYFKQTGVVTAKEIGITGHGSDIKQIPADLRIREYPDPAKT